LLFYKRNKKLVPRALLSYISTHFSRVLKNSRLLKKLNNALGAFFISLTKLRTNESSRRHPLK